MRKLFNIQKTKLFSGLLVVALLLCFLPNGFGTMTAKAAGVTYCVRYVESKSEYRYITGSAWSDTAYNRELYYLKQDIKDGDLLVIDSFDTDPVALSLNISNVKLSNITMVSGKALITVAGCTDLYTLKSSVLSITGDVTNAHLYGTSAVNFNTNVGTVELVSPFEGTANGLGNAAKVYTLKDGKETNVCFDFAPGSLRIAGYVTTDAGSYSKTPSANTTAAMATPSISSYGTAATAVTTPAAPAATTPTATPSTTPTAPAASNSEYDDVPKTGEFPTSTILFVLAGVFGLCGGMYTVSKRKVK